MRGSRARLAAALLLALAAAASGCSATSDSDTVGDAAASGVRVEGARISLGDGAVARLGLEVAPVGAAQATVERTAFGRVLEPLTLVEPVLAQSAARDSLEQARSEYARARGLHEHDRNASTRDVEVARLGFERAELDARLAAARVAAAWGPVAGERADLEALAGRLAAGSAAVGRLDLPAGEAPAAAPESVQLSLPGRGSASVAARVLGPAPAADPVLQTRGVLVLVEVDPPAPGTSLAARIPMQGAPVGGAWLPASAVLWHDGDAVAFVEAGEGAFERRPIERIRSLGDGWLVGAGVRPGDRVVVRGAQQLLSAQVLPAETPGERDD